MGTDSQTSRLPPDPNLQADAFRRLQSSKNFLENCDATKTSSNSPNSKVTRRLEEIPHALHLLAGVHQHAQVLERDVCLLLCLCPGMQARQFFILIATRFERWGRVMKGTDVAIEDIGPLIEIIDAYALGRSPLGIWGTPWPVPGRLVQIDSKCAPTANSLCSQAYKSGKIRCDNSRCGQ
jgi:hypothetical protein